ncbi:MULTISPECIES: hypothetical protein [Nocardia]|uniref:hypothetical protein n=1 Tax=Nocardia TaxID=1817 RepID=UPI002458B8BA|nr:MULTISPECIES: hypothetical protein [Nocardia]
MSLHETRSLVAHYATTPMWEWVVVPWMRPDIYIPAATEELAHSIARDIDRGNVGATVFIHKQTTFKMRAALGLAEATDRTPTT